MLVLVAIMYFLGGISGAVSFCFVLCRVAVSEEEWKSVDGTHDFFKPTWWLILLLFGLAVALIAGADLITNNCG